LTMGGVGGGAGVGGGGNTMLAMHKPLLPYDPSCSWNPFLAGEDTFFQTGPSLNICKATPAPAECAFTSTMVPFPHWHAAVPTPTVASSAAVAVDRNVPSAGNIHRCNGALPSHGRISIPPFRISCGLIIVKQLVSSLANASWNPFALGAAGESAVLGGGWVMVFGMGTALELRTTQVDVTVPSVQGSRQIGPCMFGGTEISWTPAEDADNIFTRTSLAMCSFDCELNILWW
jgi:hypothetical protein